MLPHPGLSQPCVVPCSVTKAAFSFFHPEDRNLALAVLQLDTASGALCVLSKYLRDEAMLLYNYRLVHFTNIGSENSQVEKNNQKVHVYFS